MEQNVYSSPAHNVGCSHRFTCGAVKCPDAALSSEKPSCHIDRFKRYQPDSEIWYRRNWEEVNRINWREVFSLDESWIYILLVIIIVVFIFMVLVLIKLFFKI